MNYRPKVVRCRLKTGGKSIPQIREECRGQGLTYRDFENIQRSNEEFDGLVVLLSLWDYDNHASYHLHNWDPADDEKMTSSGRAFSGRDGSSGRRPGVGRSSALMSTVNTTKYTAIWARPSRYSTG